MPVEMFLDEFLSPVASEDRSDMLSSTQAFDAVPQQSKEPSMVYEPLVAALNERTAERSRCPGLVFEQTFDHSMRPFRTGYAKPHICCFTPENLARVRDTHPGLRVEFGYAELFIQITSDPTLDYFRDPDPDANADAAAPAAHDFIRQYDYVDEFEDRALWGEIQYKYHTIDLAHGQHISFAIEALARQHRVFIFTISVAGSFARLFRWDRSGCVVTRSFDIRQHPHLLVEFLWRFAKLSDAGRGHDQTARVASPAEESLFRDTIRQNVALQLDVVDDKLDKAVTAHYVPGSVAALPVDTLQSGTRNREYFLVSRPIVSPLSLDGRGTRGFWAVNALTGRIAFLKDTWRTPWSRRHVEGDVLRRLNEVGVRNVPLLALHGDVTNSIAEPSEMTNPEYQETRTDAFVGEPWICRLGKQDVRTGQRRHYRLVTHTVGYSLNTMQGTEEMLYAGYDVFIAMRDALAKGSRIHRDLSVGNIILVKEPDRPVRKGYLIDWDASDCVDEDGMALHAGRTGTWAFLSIRMLEPSLVDTKHTFKDDMEALLYVVFYCALFYTPHNLDKEELTVVHKTFFYHYENVFAPGGGNGKIANAGRRDYTHRMQFGSAEFQEWLNTMMDYHHPSDYDQVSPRSMWEPDCVDQFWSHFLSTHTLEKDDRVVHELSHMHQYNLLSPDSEPIPTPYATPRTLLARDRRDVSSTNPSENNSEDGSRKRARSEDDEDDGDDGASRSLSTSLSRRTSSPGPTLVRRSKRIREQQTRRTSAPAAAPAPAGKPTRTKGIGSAYGRSRKSASRRRS
ncbi:hypothetical protein PYCCODRAFT_1471940 [Trametes coccinea BRFM310]|uniref:Fungal-type protein kinase domain-containing protein n=1 Tax=Trametes coccinea (strain BRFM310) TaxID=1353009 RepID=A0A1Y2I884_TRAC3|nr:hypothetical protein PYCCODRAFT_1471940 [Trametes coccinea BRFM310]